ncbi:hypothetical protein [Agrococcus baldri]|uniref:DUF4190 domain-containing protein n=1 Tax=Agrococcus baldri TaxID=153730 RepID=A0AA87UWZ9_9MICO|nr:hypothetical protein [Agrococcus baldri]GEK79862.1 hypothetical protein ABA31_12130 [Agrococcus baldri]
MTGTRAAGAQGADTARAEPPRSWSTLTIAALVLSGLGLLFAFASGLGLPLALAGIICGGVAMRRDRAARPWPLVALLAGLLGAVIAATLVVLTAVVWAPLLPGLLFG